MTLVSSDLLLQDGDCVRGIGLDLERGSQMSIDDRGVDMKAN